MELLAKLVVSFIELAETELAILKKGIVRLGLSLVMVVAAGVLGTIGLCWLLNALFLVLERLLGRPAAFAISGLAFLGGAAALLVLAMKTRTPAAVAPTIAQTGAEPPHTHAAEGDPMTPPHSESHLEDKLIRAKQQLLTAAYDASPLRVVERKPWLAVTATASATLAATVLATSPLFGRASIGILRQGFGLASALMKSNFASPLAAAAVAKFASHQQPPQQQDSVNAVG